MADNLRVLVAVNALMRALRMLLPPPLTLCGAGILLLLLTIAVTPVAAQKTTLDASIIAPDKSPAVIRNQLTLAAKIGRRALAELEACPADEPMPPEESVLQPARDTYVLIRAALAGVQRAREFQKYPDPLMELVYQRVFSAWNLSRTPVGGASSAGPSRREYLTVSATDLRSALRLVDQALVLLP